tara:strand:+ start:308 stop:1240 length:933 start_codon:yes stop_codon:yes gene_type:complete
MNINNSNNSNIPTDTISEINILELLLILFKNKYTIILCTFIFAISSVFYSLSIPNQYISKSVVSINGDTEVTGGSLGGNLGGIASLAGISLSSGGDVSKSSIVEATFKSRVFINHLLNQEKFLFNLMAVNGYDVNNNKAIIDTNLYDIEKASWKTNKKPKNIDSYYAFLNNFSYSRDDETGLVTVSFKNFSPYISKDLLDILLFEIDTIIKNKDIIETEKSLVYLQDQLEKTQQSNIRASINSLIFNELQAQMVANISESYLFDTIDPPYVPIEKSSPVRSAISVFGTLFGFILSIIYVLTRQFFINKKF